MYLEGHYLQSQQFSCSVLAKATPHWKVMLFDLNQKMYPFMCRIHSHQLWWVHRYHLVVVHAVF